MNKQEKIREGIKKVIWRLAAGGIQPSEAYKKLSELDVVIKVDRELPKNPFDKNKSAFNEAAYNGWELASHRYNRAGYVATEPLVEE